ncbi:MAG: hypothetical protein IPN76_08105 [Saprospiraceae bacterium]|nr:hypothetical protein [Saprospiraceae bacterium]
MSKLQFNKVGYLSPGEPIQLTLTELSNVFVAGFPNSERRRWLFDNFERYLYRFQDELFPHFEVWVNGSFVTLVEEPNDIDFVVFLDYQVFEARGEKVTDKFWTFSLENQGLDANLVKVYPMEHNEFVQYNEQTEIWSLRYSNSRADNKGVVQPKNFVKIIFEP